MPVQRVLASSIFKSTSPTQGLGLAGKLCSSQEVQRKPWPQGMVALSVMFRQRSFASFLLRHTPVDSHPYLPHHKQRGSYQTTVSSNRSKFLLYVKGSLNRSEMPPGKGTGKTETQAVSQINPLFLPNSPSLCIFIPFRSTDTS